MNNKIDKECYDSDCEKNICDEPKHYNFICMDPDCENTHCENHEHYNKQLLKEFQDSTDFTVYDHSSSIKHDPNAKIKICSCDDCNDEEEHHHNHSHEEESCGCEEHDHHHSHDHSHHHHHEEECHCHEEEDSCSDEECHCHDDDIKICNCDDCNDEEDVIKDGIPLLANRSIQIIVSSGILFALGHILEFTHAVNETIITIIFVVAAIISGYEIAKLAWKAITKRHTITPAVLMCIACVASFIIGHPEEGAAVTFLYYIAEFLEDYAELRAQKSIKSLVEIAPDTARVKTGDTEEIQKVDEVKVDDIVIVKPGDKIPLDGVVSKGSSSINQASITGESVPVQKNIGDKVFAGTVNEDGFLEIRVTTTSSNSVIAKIVSLVKQSQLNRSETETLVEKISKYYTPAIIVITVLVAFVPPVLFGEDLVSWIYRALSIMVISCPCAFLISTPIGMVSSITSATRQGVLIKGSTHVEEMRNIKAVIFDKTGTLTEGKLEVTGIEVLDDKYSINDVLNISASLESNSSHPIAIAIEEYAKGENVSFLEVHDFKNIPGKGIVGQIDGKKYYVANESLIEGSEFDLSKKEVHNYTDLGATVVFLGNEEHIIGAISVKDKIRKDAKEVMHRLNDAGIQTVMLTGDNKVVAQKVGDELGVKYIYSDLMPEDKLNIVDTIRNKFGDVAMVGDGINDAPALARSNIGIAMGAVGSDVAIETADVALMQDDLTKLPYLFRLSRKTMGIIKQNIITAITVKFLFVILAILGWITLMMSVGLGDMGLTLLVILNSFRIGLLKD